MFAALSPQEISGSLRNVLKQVTGYSKHQTPLFVRYSPCSWGEALSRGSVCPKAAVGEMFSRRGLQLWSLVSVVHMPWDPSSGGLRGENNRDRNFRTVAFNPCVYGWRVQSGVQIPDTSFLHLHLFSMPRRQFSDETVHDFAPEGFCC